MPTSLLIVLKEEEYEKIPRPKNTWVRELVKRELAKLTVNDLGDVECEWAFLVGGKIVIGKGFSKTEAALSMGFTREQVFDGVTISRHGTVEESAKWGVMDEAIKPEHWAFRVGGKVHFGVGITPADAAQAAGLVLDPTMEYLPEPQARAEGWFDSEDRILG